MVGEMFEAVTELSDMVITLDSSPLVRLYHYLKDPRAVENIKRTGSIFRGSEYSDCDTGRNGVNFTTIPPTKTRLTIAAGTGLMDKDLVMYCLCVRVPINNLSRPYPDGPYFNTWRVDAKKVDVLVDGVVDMLRNEARSRRGLVPLYPQLYGSIEQTRTLPYIS